MKSVCCWVLLSYLAVHNIKNRNRNCNVSCLSVNKEMPTATACDTKQQKKYILIFVRKHKFSTEISEFQIKATLWLKCSLCFHKSDCNY